MAQVLDKPNPAWPMKGLPRKFNILTCDFSVQCLRTLVGHSGGVWSSQMVGDLVISGSTDRTLRVWNAKTGQCLKVLAGHTSTVRCMHLHQNR